MEFRVAYDEDIEQVTSLISKIVNDHEKTLEDPSPTVQMDELSPYAMVFVVRPWVEKADYWPVRWELLKLIKEKLDAGGIKIPTINEGVLMAP